MFYFLGDPLNLFLILYSEALANIVRVNFAYFAFHFTKYPPARPIRIINWEFECRIVWKEKPASEP